MNWIAGLQNAIDYIENNLTEELDYTDIASKAFTSPFYFQRVFGVLCNCTLGEYIRNRRLTLAGSELSSSDAKVIDVAFKYGYDSPESFSRAFTRFHGIAPSYAKMYGSKLKSFSRLSVKLILDGGNIMNYRIEKKDKIDIIVKKKSFSNDIEQNNKELPKYWDDCRNDHTIDSLYKYAAASGVFGGSLIGVCFDDAQKNEVVTYAIGVEYNGTAITDELSVEQIPAYTWAIFESIGPMPTAFQNLLYKVYSEFFPTSVYHPCGNLDIEVYPDGNMQSPQYKCELWIPVEKNEQA